MNENIIIVHFENYFCHMCIPVDEIEETEKTFENSIKTNSELFLYRNSGFDKISKDKISKANALAKLLLEPRPPQTFLLTKKDKQYVLDSIRKERSK